MNFIKKLKRRELFFKITTSYLVIGLFLIFAFTFLTYKNVYKNTIVQVKQWNKTVQMQAVGSSSEIMESIENQISDLERNDAEFIKAMQYEDFDKMDIYGIVNRLWEVKRTNTLIRSIYLYNDVAKIMITTEDTPKKAEQFQDKYVMEMIEDRRKGQDRYVVRDIWDNFYVPKEKERVLSIIFYHNIDDEKDKSAITVNIDQKVFSEIVLKPDVVNNRNALVFNKNAEVFIGDEDKIGVDPSALDKIVSQNQEEGAFDLKGRKGEALVTYRYQNKLGLYYAFINYYDDMAGEAQQNFKTMSTIIILLMGIVLLFSFIMGFFVYRPFRQIFNRIQETGSDEDVGELENMDNSIGKLVKTAWKNAESEKEKTFKMLKNGEISPDYEEYDQRIELLLPKKNIRVVKVMIEGFYGVKAALPKKEIKLIHFIIKNVLEELFMKIGNAVFYSLEEPVVDGVINYENATEKDIEEILGTVAVFINDKMNVRISYAVSEEVLRSKVSVVFAQTEIMYKNRIMKDRKEIAFYSDDFDRELTEENEYSYPHKTDTQIMDALRGQKANDISLLLNIFLEQTAQFSDDSIITAFMQLIAHANKVVSDIVVRECVLQAADFETVRNILNDLKDRDLIKEWLNSLFSKYLEILSEGKDKKKEAVIEAAKDYIAGHYKDENLTVDDVAGNVGLSTNYLRSIFKKYEGIGVGEYILDVRLNHVYRMLRDTNLSIHQISRENGFANTNYFFTVFKKKTGMTPDQYRKSSSDV